jgi:putative flippase GtrA
MQLRLFLRVVAVETRGKRCRPRVIVDPCLHAASRRLLDGTLHPRNRPRTIVNNYLGFEETSGLIPIMCCGRLSERAMMHVSFYERARIWVLAGWRNRAVTFKAVVYALVGVVNTAIDYSVFLTAHAVLGLPLVAANTLSWMVAVSVSYTLNSTITFAAESGRKLRWLAYFTFVASGIAGWLANTAALVVAVQDLLLPVWLAKLLAVMASFIVNFSMSHFVVFRVRRSLPATT